MAKVPRKHGTRKRVAGALLLVTLMGCSSSLIKGPDPVCGASISRGGVLVVDLTDENLPQGSVDEAIRKQAGSYRIMTEEAVWIPKRRGSGNTGYPSSIAGVQSIAADWGCNLLVLLDSKMSKTDVRTQARNEDRVWLVVAGKRQ